MNKEFVPYQESFELKELGFDEPCFGKWLSSAQSNWKKYELILEMGMNEEFEDNRNIYLLEGACSAPTFSQAFRWFREKYNIDAWVQPFATEKSNGTLFLPDESYSYFIFKDGEFVADKVDLLDTEEAELACLQKLIEIVKQNP